MPKKSDNALIVFLRYPEEGKAKTRLAGGLGARRAAALYREMAEFVVRSFSGSGKWKTFFFYSPPERKKEILEWLGGEESGFFAQRGGSLGERMSRAFEKCFSLGFANAVIIGTDCIMMTGRDVEKAFSLLSGGEFEAVLGPAADGGYYLLGLGQPTEAVFENISWGSDRVFEETERRLGQASLRRAVMRELPDIDEEKDLDVEKIAERDEELAQRFALILAENGET